MRPSSELQTSVTLLARLANPSDELSWHQFDQCYGPFIVRYCLRKGLTLADAEDVRQLACITLVKTLPNFKYDPNRGKFRGYLASVVRRSIGRHINPSESSATKSLEYEQVSDDLTDEIWEEEWRNHHYRIAIEHIVTTLKPIDAAVFNDLARGMPPQLVATNHNLNTDLVYKIKQRVRDQLRDQVNEQIEHEEKI